MTYQTENLVSVPATNFGDVPETDNIDYDYDYDNDYDDNQYDNDTCEPMITDQELDFYREERYLDSLISGEAVWTYAPHPINTNSKRWDMGTLDFPKTNIDTPTVEYNDFPKFSKKLLDRMVREKDEILTSYAAIKAAEDKKIRDEAAALKAQIKKMKDKIHAQKKKAGEILEKQKAVAIKALDEALTQKRKAAQEKRKQAKIDEEAANKKRIEIISKIPVVEPVPIVEELDEVAQQERQEIDAFIAKVKSMPTFTELVPEVKPVPVVVAPKVEPAPPPAPKPAPAPAPAPKPVEVWQEVKKPVAKKPIAKPVEHSAPPPRQTTGKTKLCKSVADKDGKMLPKAQHLRCHHKVCMFAHSFNEIDVLLCRYGSRCRDKQTCRGCHPEETKEKWIQRTMC